MSEAKKRPHETSDNVEEIPKEESEPSAKKMKLQDETGSFGKISDFLPSSLGSTQPILELPAFAAHTDAGSRYGPLNQDYFFMERLKQPNGHGVVVIGVFDGHGKHGEKASKLASDFFKKQLSAHLTQSKHVSIREHEKAMRNIFEGAHKRILSEYENLTSLEYDGYTFSLMMTTDRVDFYSSPDCPYVLLQDFGTTAVVCIYWEETQKLMVANCGDSDALIGRWDSSSGVIQPNLLAISDNVSCTTNGEQERIRREFGRKTKFGGGYLSPNDQTYGFHSLAMTRALGHKFLEKYGVTWDPHIRSFQITPEDLVLVVASDGLFDVVNTKAIVSVAAERQLVEGRIRTLLPQEASERLVKLALTNWKRQFTSIDVADNTTVCVLKLSAQFDEKVPQRDELSNSGTSFSPALTVFHAIEAEREEASKEILSTPHANTEDGETSSSTPIVPQDEHLPASPSSVPSNTSEKTSDHQSSTSTHGTSASTSPSASEGLCPVPGTIAPLETTKMDTEDRLEEVESGMHSENGKNLSLNSDCGTGPAPSGDTRLSAKSDLRACEIEKSTGNAAGNIKGSEIEASFVAAPTTSVAEILPSPIQAQSPLMSNFSTTPSETPPIVPHNTPLESDSSTASSCSVSHAVTPPNGEAIQP